MNRMFAFTPTRRASLAALAFAAAGAVSAAPIDVAPITAAGADVAAIGGAVFLVMVGIKVFKWIRRAL